MNLPDNALLDDIVFSLGAEQVAYDLVYKQEALSILKKGEALSKLQQTVLRKNSLIRTAQAPVKSII